MSGMCVKWLTGQSQVGFAQRFVLGGVGVDQRSDIFCMGLPAVDQLRFADQFANPIADQVDPQHGTVLDRDQFDEALRLQDLALAVAAQIVGERLDLVSVDLARLSLIEADRSNLWVGVGDPRDGGVLDGFG